MAHPSIRDSSPTLRREFSPSSDAPLRFAGRTHPGRRGGENEDSLGWDPNLGIWVLADGMGGHSAGHVASRIARDAFLERAARGSMFDSAQHAHLAVTGAAAASADHRGMGTTLVAVRVVGDLCSIVWVGDSRAYLMRRGALRALTRDHSFVESLRDHAELSETQIQNHPNRNLVTQTLGMGTPVPSSAEEPLKDGDRILLCSDGLNDELSDREIADILAAHPMPDQAADALVTAALDRGGRDNVTVIVIEYDSRFGKPPPPRGRGSGKARAAVLAGAGAAVVLALLWWFLSGLH